MPWQYWHGKRYKFGNIWWGLWRILYRTSKKVEGEKKELKKETISLYITFCCITAAGDGDGGGDFAVMAMVVYHCSHSCCCCLCLCCFGVIDVLFVWESIALVVDGRGDGWWSIYICSWGGVIWALFFLLTLLW